jgi:hypothetical protein
MWRLPGAQRHGIGFSDEANSSSGGLQPDDTWFGDPLATPALPSQFASRKRSISPTASHPARTVPKNRVDIPFHTQREASPAQQVPSVALQAGRFSLDGLVPGTAPPAPDEAFASEVWRITGIDSNDYRRVLDLESHEFLDMNVISSKYRRLMRLLHPDKRRAEEQSRAGGKQRCDLAMKRVQEALNSAKKRIQPKAHTSTAGEDDAVIGKNGTSQPSPYRPNGTQKHEQPDPHRDLQDGMRRMQEIQRRQAQMAMQRTQHQHSTMEEGPDLGSLLSDISQALDSSVHASCASSAPPPRTSDTTAELMDLLASLRQSK